MQLLRTLYKNESGQSLLLSVMVIGGVLIGATAIAGLLLKYQLRQTNDVVNSTKAFFAADAGIEKETYSIMNAVPEPVFSNGAMVTSSWAMAGPNIVVRSQGVAGGAVRALESYISAAQSAPTPQPQITQFDISGNTNLVASPCSGKCQYKTNNPDTGAPVASPANVTITWASSNASTCAGSSNPAGIWTAEALSGSSVVDIGAQNPPITFTLVCSLGTVSASTSTVITFTP